ncbi:MAG: type III pantothenate kinase [Chloroflexia bacterium]|nr:type III pantothenate kinase [Chloroflexia bacterium]
MLLCIDVGNTNIVLGLYRGETLVNHWRIATGRQRMADEYAALLLVLLEQAGHSPRDIQAGALASVVPPLTGVFVDLCRRYLEIDPLVVDAGVRTGVRIRYDNPREVGADRVVNAAATLHKYGGPACVVDFGTGTTFDAISAEGDYVGGAIAPGIGIAAWALTERAAKLPRVDIARPPQAIGRNTVHSIQSGLLFGYVGLVKELVQRFRQELGPNMRVIATGGLAELLAQETDVFDAVDPWLTIEGLRLIYALNHPA